MKLGIKNRIVQYFTKHQDEWINGGEIERLALKVGYKASNASRRLRELAEVGFLKREEKKGTVWYKYETRKQNQATIKKTPMENFFSLYKTA